MTRILVIDDETLVLRNVGMMLEWEGYEVLVTDSGAIGLETALKMRPDVIICDIGMPGMNGLEVLQALRNNADTRDTAVIMITDIRDEEINNELLERGANAYLPKPFSRDRLLEVISTLF
jgi:CheY-like chemotaxis protein